MSEIHEVLDQPLLMVDHCLASRGRQHGASGPFVVEMARQKMQELTGQRTQGRSIDRVRSRLDAVSKLEQVLMLLVEFDRVHRSPRVQGHQ
jgi:hypothetical protein